MRGKAARVNISLAPAILATNTPAPAPEKAAPVNPAAANTLPALVHLLTLGATVLALAPQLINTLVRAPATPVVWAPPVVASMRLVPAPAATSGTAAAVNSN